MNAKLILNVRSVELQGRFEIESLRADRYRRWVENELKQRQNEEAVVSALSGCSSNKAVQKYCESYDRNPFLYPGQKLDVWPNFIPDFPTGAGDIYRRKGNNEPHYIRKYISRAGVQEIFYQDGAVFPRPRACSFDYEFIFASQEELKVFGKVRVEESGLEAGVILELQKMIDLQKVILDMEDK